MNFPNNFKQARLAALVALMCSAALPAAAKDWPSGYSKCADEGETCTIKDGKRLVSFGVKDSFVKAFGVEGEGLLRRVGEPTEAQRKVALNMASVKADKVSHELFEVRSCKTCHAVTRTDKPDGPDWTVAKIRANNLWMPGSRFDHKSHAQTACTDCHAVTKSKLSTDVAMPMPRSRPAARARVCSARHRSYPRRARARRSVAG